MREFYIDLFDQFKAYEKSHSHFMSIPHLELYSDGSGSMRTTTGTILFEFHNLEHLMTKLKPDNSKQVKP